ncbi:plasmid mobilization protein [Aminobacter aminovorans]|uniref:plasmid mobilization protein n=1 Tax=Aminobacter aminovorans TaxID=83263 RepID=UPI002859711A|nr:ribbon-helix-helix protein, CopG family [Aminobacter aminovorans]MDR7221693.1 uncharacterized protein (DUF1778 family) [Aminobacter aminovorans]
MRFSEAMDGMIKVRVSHDEKRALKEAARQRGLTLSEMLRVTATEATSRVGA